LSPNSSSLRVQYDLRPAKQVERRMIVDALQRLQPAGFTITDYQYTGFGAIYFVDFILFHKLLGMSKLLSLERATSLAKRMEFNKPFKCVDIKMEPASAAIPNLSRDTLHFLWLDYDGIIRKDFLSDIQSAITILSAGSILLVTVDVEPPEEQDYKEVDPDFDGSKEVMGPKHWRQYFEFQAKTYLRLGLTDSDFGKAELGSRTSEILKASFIRSMVPRAEMEFLPMFNFVYKDSHSMLSMGGMIAGPSEKRNLLSTTLRDTKYYRDSFDTPPFEISVPRLTRKERIYLDREMPCADGWTPKEFDLDPDELRKYREIYRFLPAFAEILV